MPIVIKIPVAINSMPTRWPITFNVGVASARPGIMIGLTPGKKKCSTPMPTIPKPKKTLPSVVIVFIFFSLKCLANNSLERRTFAIKVAANAHKSEHL